MISVGIKNDSLNRLKDSLNGTASSLPREVATAINATSKKVRTEAARELKKELNVPVKVLKKAIKGKSKASAKDLRAVVGLIKGHPIPLRYFKPRKTKRGVTAKLNPKIKGKAGKTVYPHAFIVAAYSGKVYQRAGKERGPLTGQQLFGPSPGDAFEQAGIAAMAEKLARDELPKQIERRIRFLLLKQSGGLRGRQPTN
jgi:hypothetical protein